MALQYLPDHEDGYDSYHQGQNDEKMISSLIPVHRIHLQQLQSE
jgi:hypothetical protein